MSSDQQRFQVFVSSTYSDLREARQQVTMTLLECDAFPTGMEIFPRRNSPSRRAGAGRGKGLVLLARIPMP